MHLAASGEREANGTLVFKNVRGLRSEEGTQWVLTWDMEHTYGRTLIWTYIDEELVNTCDISPRRSPHRLSCGFVKVPPRMMLQGFVAVRFVFSTTGSVSLDRFALRAQRN